MTDPYIGINGTKIEFFDNDISVIKALAELAQLGSWTPAGTFTYASASTITVAAGATGIYQKGDKLKFVQHSVVKYFYVVAIASTLLTVTAGSVNTVEDTATYPITLPYYSHAENPVGFPHWFLYTPTFTGFSTDPTDIVSVFKITGRNCIFNFYAGTGGTSNNAAFTVTLPVTAIVLIGMLISFPIRVLDNGAWLATAGLLQISSAATTALLGKTCTITGGFTASGFKTSSFMINYPI